MTRTWVFRIGLAFGFWLVLTGTAYVLGNHPRPGLIALMIAAGAGTVWLYLDTSAESLNPRWTLLNDEPIRDAGEDSRLALLERVVSAHLDARDVTDDLQRYLRQIADQRLVSRHGISRIADPDRAAGILGPGLAEFLASTTPRRLTTTQIDQLLNRIEAL